MRAGMTTVTATGPPEPKQIAAAGMFELNHIEVQKMIVASLGCGKYESQGIMVTELREIVIAACSQTGLQIVELIGIVMGIVSVNGIVKIADGLAEMVALGLAARSRATIVSKGSKTVVIVVIRL